jgi:hypothetical protein
MMRFEDDPFEEGSDSPRQITSVTRRDIFGYTRTRGGPWHGRMDEVGS